MVIGWLKRLARPNEEAPEQPVQQTSTLDGSAAAVAEAIALSQPNVLDIPREKIAQRAYEKWVGKGRPVGTSHQDWLEAEAELRAELRLSGERLPHRPR